MNDHISGQIFNIQRYSLHDGSGIRTLVFFKGCPMRCLWCSNPESQKGSPELGFIKSRCVGAEICGAPCVTACSLQVIHLNKEGKPLIDRVWCEVCGQCAEACPEDALKVVGREMSVADVMTEVEKDMPFYRRSGGGLTLGGGEPLAQYRFALALLEAAEAGYLHTAIETSGHVPWKQFAQVLNHVDLLQIDLKHIDPERHRELTGQSNALILENMKKILSIKEPQDVIIRVPIIPGCNDDQADIEEIANFVIGLGFTQIELIPYHKMGTAKYSQYDMIYPLDGLEPPTEAEIEYLRHLVEDVGLREMTGEV